MPFNSEKMMLNCVIALLILPKALKRPHSGKAPLPSNTCALTPTLSCLSYCIHLEKVFPSLQTKGLSNDSCCKTFTEASLSYSYMKFTG